MEPNFGTAPPDNFGMQPWNTTVECRSGTQRWNTTLEYNARKDRQKRGTRRTLENVFSTILRGARRASHAPQNRRKNILQARSNVPFQGSVPPLRSKVRLQVAVPGVWCRGRLDMPVSRNRSEVGGCLHGSTARSTATIEVVMRPKGWAGSFQPRVLDRSSHRRFPSPVLGAEEFPVGCEIPSSL